MTEIECNIPNCRRNAPAGEAFCSEHRDTDQRARIKALEAALAPFARAHDYANDHTRLGSWLATAMDDLDEKDFRRAARTLTPARR